MIDIQNLTMRFGADCVLDNLSASIREGEVVSVIGPSGTGKSTLLRCINRLENPESGSILIDGEDILAPHADVPRIRRKTGMVFQSFNLFDHLTVLDNLMIGPVRILKHTRRDAEARGHELLRMVGLGEKAMSLPGELSGGQKQRVAIARCLSMQPKIMLFDEPTSALDPTMISEVLAVIRRLTRDGMTMMIVTHELNFARDVSNRIFYMDDRGIYESGPPEQIMSAPQKEKTRRFINRLRSFFYRIDGPDFDAFGMNAEIETFCEKHLLSRRMSHHTLLAVEESLSLYFAHANYRAVALTISYAEKDGTLHLRFEDQQPPCNFLEDASCVDDIALTVLKGIVHDIRCERTEEGNRVSMTLNEAG
ncbi:MAG TPA: amino acid ABC transporter ATP-binding protein [Verrucomicrobia bacterium]|nr:amino acid ABC transporter ATP-binding protein [Verrucomicrobiota bacterium]